MDVLIGCVGLSIAFLLLATMLLYFVIKTKGYYTMKSIMIVLMLYYSLVLIYTPNKLLGWPTNASMPPNAILLYLLFDEPKPGEKGSIYIWAITKDPSVKKPILEQLHYENIFRYNVLGVPRVYRIPYTKENHKLLWGMWNKARERQMFLMFVGGGEGGSESNDSYLNVNQFEVINRFDASQEKEGSQESNEN